MRSLLLLALPLLAAPVHTARLTGVAIVPGEVTIAADAAPAGAHQLALADPYRLVVDLPASIAAPLAAPGAGSVRSLRAAMFAPGVARLVLDLAAPLAIVAARAGPGGLTIALRRVTPAEFAAIIRRGRRPLAIEGAPAPVAAFELPPDLFGPRAPPASLPPAGTPAIGTPDTPPTGTPPTGTPPTGPQAPAATPPVALPTEAAAPRPPRAGRPLVVIDAGHGGKDVGAISITGAYEKDVTLAIARATAKALNRNGKVRARLTRSDDRFLPLGGRVAIARAARADLFISIHADAAPNPQARGASVYTLSAIASDAVAARLAARENKADIIAGVNLGVDAPDVADIMIDLSRRATGNVSVAFAETLQAALSDRIAFRGQFHHFAGFRVLKAPDVPSVLLETGYVTNAEDATFLASDDGRTRIAQGIARAVETHLAGD